MDNLSTKSNAYQLNTSNDVTKIPIVSAGPRDSSQEQYQDLTDLASKSKTRDGKTNYTFYGSSGTNVAGELP